MTQNIIDKAKIEIAEKLKEIEALIVKHDIDAVIVTCIHDLQEACDTWVSVGGDKQKIRESLLPITVALEEEIEQLDN